METELENNNEYEDFEIIIEESDEEQKNDLTVYVSPEKEEYFIGSEICDLIGYLNTTRAISNISDDNKITFKNYTGKKEPLIDPRQILIKKEGVYELLEKNTKKLSDNTITILKNANIDVSRFIKNDEKSEEYEEYEKRELTEYSYASNGYRYVYFIGYEISSLIGYSNVTHALNNISKQNKLEFRDYPGVKIPKLDPKTILISQDGAIELLIKTRKIISPDVLHLLKQFCIDPTNRKCFTKEQQTLSLISNAYKTEKIEDQFKVGKYYLDMYFPDQKIVVECDENGHKDRKPCDERERMDFINNELDIDDSYWIRYNPDEYNFDLSKVIGKIYNRIILSKEEKIEKEIREKLDGRSEEVIREQIEEQIEIKIQKKLEKKLNLKGNFEKEYEELKEKLEDEFKKKDYDILDLLTRRCNMCYEEKSLYENFSKNGCGYRMTCKDCFGSTGKEKPVKQYNLDGTFIERFSSVKEASEKSKLCPSQIAANCRGMTKRAGNYMWVFVKEESKAEIKEENKKDEIIMETGTRIVIIDSDYDSDSKDEPDEEKIAAVKYETCRMVAQYNTDGQLIQTHKSVAEACRFLGQKNKRSLYGAIKNNFVSFGFVWRYVENDVIIQKIEPIAPFKKYMKPVEIYKDGVLCNTFKCIKDAADGMKVNVSMCRKFLEGTHKDPKNFEWKFLVI